MEVSRSGNSQSKLGFGKVIKVNVLVDNLPTMDEKKVKKAVRSLVQILQKHDTEHPKADIFIRTFQQNVPDYKAPVSSVDQKNPIIRSLIDISTRFLFTGQQAAELQPLAKAIGKAKGRSRELLNTTRTYEAKLAVDNYFDKAKSFIIDQSLMLTSTQSQKPLELKIFTRGLGNPSSNKFKLIIDCIKFERS